MENKEKLLTLIQKVLHKDIQYPVFVIEFDDLYWSDGVHSSLEEIDNEFFYRVCECITYVDDTEAGNWGFRSSEEYLAWLDRSFKEYTEDRDAWYGRVKGVEDMWG